MKGRRKINKKKMKKLSFIILFAGLMVVPLLSMAQGPEPIITHPDQVVGLLSSILGYVWTIMGIIVVLLLLFAGFKFMTAAGNDEEIKKAKEIIKYSVIGIVIMVLSGGVMALIENFMRGA